MSMLANVKEQLSRLTTLYRRLSPNSRRVLWTLLGVELVAITAAERDLARRPAACIRGPKLMWRAVATQNLIGPVAYWTLGRRRTP